MESYWGWVACTRNNLDVWSLTGWPVSGTSTEDAKNKYIEEVRAQVRAPCSCPQKLTVGARRSKNMVLSISRFRTSNKSAVYKCSVNRSLSLQSVAQLESKSLVLRICTLKGCALTCHWNEWFVLLYMFVKLLICDQTTKGDGQLAPLTGVVHFESIGGVVWGGNRIDT